VLVIGRTRRQEGSESVVGDIAGSFWDGDRHHHVIG
jgi:hypothetical protein